MKIRCRDTFVNILMYVMIASKDNGSARSESQPIILTNFETNKVMVHISK